MSVDIMVPPRKPLPIVPRAMSVVQGRPPIIEKIVRVFPGASSPTVVFAWGDTIFSPSTLDLRPEILAHEGVHGARQGDGERILDWWHRYLYDPEFRLVEELLAHAAELRMLQSGGIRQARRRALGDVAAKLAAPLYRWPSLTEVDATRMLEAELRS